MGKCFHFYTAKNIWFASFVLFKSVFLHPYCMYYLVVILKSVSIFVEF